MKCKFDLFYEKKLFFYFYNIFKFFMERKLIFKEKAQE